MSAQTPLPLGRAQNRGGLPAPPRRAAGDIHPVPVLCVAALLTCSGRTSRLQLKKKSGRQRSPPPDLGLTPGRQLVRSPGALGAHTGCSRGQAAPAASPWNRDLCFDQLHVTSGGHVGDADRSAEIKTAGEAKPDTTLVGLPTRPGPSWPRNRGHVVRGGRDPYEKSFSTFPAQGGPWTDTAGPSHCVKERKKE